MNDLLSSMEEILADQICGFHQLVLAPTVHLSYASRSLCEMLGVSERELLDDRTDPYRGLIQPDDRQRYSALIHEVVSSGRAAAGEYRLVKKDGTVLCVRDTIAPKRLEDGTLVGHSVLTDITDLRDENDELRSLDRALPFGTLRYTCENQPRITYIDRRMIELLRFPEAREGELDQLELCKRDIFLMIPAEERLRFSRYLDRVRSSDVPIAGDMTLLRCDGTRVHVFGWVAKGVDEQGREEFQSVCMDVTERYRARRARENERYLQALTEVYDKIFAFDLDANTVTCLYCEGTSYFKHLESIAMRVEDALEKWLIASVDPEQRAAIRRFFEELCQRELSGTRGKPPQITYRARSTDGSVKQYTGVFIKVDESVRYYCCRETKETADTAALREENDRLKERMRDLVTYFSDGIAAFEVSPESGIKPLYATENVYGFFGYTEEEWLSLTERFTPLEDFVSYSEVPYESFAELLRMGEAEFRYLDHRTQAERRIKAICSHKEPDGSSSRYVMLYPVEDGAGADEPSAPGGRRVSIRTFGYFDVFVGDTPIAFRNKKSKELFALLVDRKGGYVTSEEAISFLWEDEPASALTFSRYRKVALRLKSTLEEYGISDIIETVDGKRRIVREKVDCDLYRYLSGKEGSSQLFKGSYLTNYSWGETTLGELMDD